MISVFANFFEVIVFTSGTDTLLAVHCPQDFWFLSAKEDVFKLVHSGIGKEQCVVINWYYRGRWNMGVILLEEEIDKILPDLLTF